MKAVHTLPEGYKEIYSVDLKENKKVFWLINLLSLLIGAMLIVPVHFQIPIFTIYDMSKGMDQYWIRMACLLVFMIAYIVLHELVHGIAMKMCGTKKIKYGFTGMYAFAGSDDYYYKKPYIFIALAPVVLWGVILAVINPFVPVEWFWVVYWIQIINLSGAAGDLFVTIRFSRFPKDVLIRDYGIGMTVYSKD